MPGTVASPTLSDALLLDLYDLTIAEAYFEHAITAPASFELFVRRLLRERRFLLTAILEGTAFFPNEPILWVTAPMPEGSWSRLGS